MAAKVRLADIVGALEMQFDEYVSFLDLDTGQVETVSLSLLGEAEETDDDEEAADLPTEQDPEWELAKRIVSTDRFRKLPTKFDVHEWAIMEEFSFSVERERLREELLDALRGTGAFRSFKAAIRRQRIEPAWYEFRTEALRQIAIDWCKENQIEWQ